jgi:regulation of enolase protein 1 (concanavalin A-like superfamily)
MMTFVLPRLPKELHWNNTPLEWNVGQDHSLTISAGERTDWFFDPAGNLSIENSPSALFTPPDENFLLSARVTVQFASMFDAGALIVYADDQRWAKLCFEYSPQKQPMIVSVVTRGSSDDCNSVPIDGNQVYLRMARKDHTMTFHFSLDGQFWHFVRYFTLGTLTNLQVGLSAQSPTGSGCTAVFSEIRYRQGTLQDNRSGE